MTNVTQTWTAERRESYGDWGAPAACWDAWAVGGDRWAEHCKRCRECREVDRVQVRRTRERGQSA